MHRSTPPSDAHPDAEAPARTVLPTRADELEPMGEAFDEGVELGILELGLGQESAASAEARRSYELHARLLRAWGEAINLSAIRDPAEVARRHVADSLTAAPVLAPILPPGASLIDLGSGAGYPGLPLAAALPLARIGLLESIRKKARFLGVAAEAVSEALGPRRGERPLIEVLAERAEDLAEDPDHRAAWDVVTARAVGSLAEVVELSMPLLREGGLVVAWKREADLDGLTAELRDAGSIIRATGGGRPDVAAVAAPSLPGHRLVVVSKLRPTPASYPRSPVMRRARRG